VSARAEQWRALAPVAPAAAVLVVLFGGAIAGALRMSLSPGGDETVRLDAWRTVLGDPVFADAVLFTAKVTAAATLLAAALAVGCAVLLRPAGRLARGAFSSPILVPHLVVAVVAVMWLGPGGLAERLLGALPLPVVRDRAGLGIVLVYVFKEVPFLTLLLLAALGPDVTAREEAAVVSGANRRQRLRWVLWPVIRPPLLLGSLIAAAFVAGSFEVPLVVGPTYPPTIATFALDATRTAALTGYAQAAVGLLIASAAALLLAVVAARAARDIDV